MFWLLFNSHYPNLSLIFLWTFHKSFHKLTLEKCNQKDWWNPHEHKSARHRSSAEQKFIGTANFLITCCDPEYCWSNFIKDSCGWRIKVRWMNPRMMAASCLVSGCIQHSVLPLNQTLTPFIHPAHSLQKAYIFFVFWFF